MFELEGRAMSAGLGAQISELADNSDLGQLWSEVTNGYLELTPTGGFHTMYRVGDAPAMGNTKLAARPATDAELAENPHDKMKVLAETRGEGGFTITAPSAGRVHPDGGQWALVAGGPGSIVTISAEQRGAIHALARAFDETPVREAPQAPPSPTDSGTRTGERPGDDYNTRMTWAQILIPLGWARVYTSGGVTYWRRPGKKIGISATTGRDTVNGAADNLYVFTSSTTFDTETPYSKFAAYTHLTHRGDWGAATKALAADGYGTSSEPLITIPTQTFTPPTYATDGNLATVHNIRTAPEPDVDAGEVTSLAHSDDGNALALIEALGHRIRYCCDRGRWLDWDGARWQWQPVGGGTIREHAKTIAREMNDVDKAGAAHKRKSLSAVGISSTLQQAATDPRITVTIDDLDSNAWELNTPGGVIDLRTGVSSPARPEQLHTRITEATPADTDDTAWLAFLAETFGDNTDGLISYLQRLVGYSAVGIVGPHVLPFCHGSGGNGKGVFLEACRGVLGDYATTAPVGFLMGRGFTGHETEIARLAGARMVICSEVNEDDIFDEAKVKQLTGGDTLTARFMRADHFTFAPTHQLWLMGNSQPSVRTGGRAFWRRIRLIPFTREVAESTMVDDLQGILVRDHGPAILAWIAQGAAAYARDGLGDPPTVLAATADYAAAQDTVGRFLDDAATLGGGEHVKVKVAIVREAYDSWCSTEGEHPVTAKAFGTALQRRGVGSIRSMNARFYTGITLLGDDDSVPSQPDRGGF